MKLTKISLLVVLFISQAFLFAEYHCKWTYVWKGKEFPTCLKNKFLTVDALHEHIDDIHIGRELRPNQCFWQRDDGSSCKERFFDIGNLRHHVKEHLPVESKLLVPDDVGDDDVVEVKKPKVKKPKAKKNQDKKQKKEPSNEDAKQVFICRYLKRGVKCKEERDSFEAFYQHILDDHIPFDNVLKCCWKEENSDICEDKFKKKDAFKKHLRDHVSSKKKQVKCNMVREREHLSEYPEPRMRCVPLHNPMNRDGKPWICLSQQTGEHCGRSFDTLVEYQDHARVHSLAIRQKYLAEEFLSD